MRYWIRELTGWALLLVGLYIFYICLLLLLNSRPRIIICGPILLMGIFVFRGGIHMLKVAVAARICLHAQKKSKDQK